MKKKLTIFVFLLASIALFAHGIVPHHHHAKVPCFEASHCQESEKNPYPCNDTEDKHHHDEPESSVCKAFSDIIYTKSQLRTSVCACHHSADHLGFDLQAVIPDLILVPKPVCENYITVSQTHFSFNLILAPSCLGLRAPPCC